MSTMRPNIPEHWTLTDTGLHRSFEFADFSGAFAFMTRVALVAESQDHHPDWSNSWNRVSITLISHDAGAVTARDLDLARSINRVADGAR